SRACSARRATCPTGARRRRPPRFSASRSKRQARRCAPPAFNRIEDWVMSIATIRNVAINYEILGARGPAMALTPGGRNPLANVRSMAERMAAAGFRVLIHDRRNCGASDVAFDPTGSEYDVSADDLHELLAQHDMLPAILGGASSGARLALAFARLHPKSVR